MVSWIKRAGNKIAQIIIVIDGVECGFRNSNTPNPCAGDSEIELLFVEINTTY